MGGLLLLVSCAHEVPPRQASERSHLPAPVVMNAVAEPILDPDSRAYRCRTAPRPPLPNAPVLPIAVAPKAHPWFEDALTCGLGRFGDLTFGPTANPVRIEAIPRWSEEALLCTAMLRAYDSAGNILLSLRGSATVRGRNRYVELDCFEALTDSLIPKLHGGLLALAPPVMWLATPPPATYGPPPHP